MRIAFLGPEGSYSSVLVRQLYADVPEAQLCACNSFAEICDFVAENTLSVGVLPIENSITSNVHENIDFVFSKNLHIVAEAYLSISLHVLALTEASLEDLACVYSHSKALEQCSQWLEAKGLSSKALASTAAARDFVIERMDTSIGLIGGGVLEACEELHIVANNVGNQKRNLTRFLCVANTPTERGEFSEHCKMSVLFTLPHRSGALARVLLAIAEAGLNLSKIESSPIPGSDFEYQFWVDVELNAADIETVPEILRPTTKEFRVIGTYEPGLVFRS